MEALRNGVKVINHFTSHIHVEAQLQAIIDMKGLPKLQLLRPIATRWESLVDAMLRLLKVGSAMTYIMLEDKAAFMDGGGSTPKNKADSREVARICCSPDFWEHLDMAIRHLAPLKVGIHHLVQQSDLHSGRSACTRVHSMRLLCCMLTPASH